MEKEYQILKEKVEDIFLKVTDIIIKTIDADKEKTILTLKVIRAVVMKFIRMSIYKKYDGILCTTLDEVIIYVTTGLLRYIPKNDTERKKEICGYINELQMLLKQNNR